MDHASFLKCNSRVAVAGPDLDECLSVKLGRWPVRKVSPKCPKHPALQGGPPTSYKWSYNPNKWPYNWVNGVITLLIGVITPFITGRGPTLCFRNCSNLSRSMYSQALNGALSVYAYIYSLNYPVL